MPPERLPTQLVFGCEFVTDADIPAFLDRLVERIGGLAADRVGVAR